MSDCVTFALDEFTIDPETFDKGCVIYRLLGLMVPCVTDHGSFVAEVGVLEAPCWYGKQYRAQISTVLQTRDIMSSGIRRD
jgi:hypothetical protein